MKLLLFATIIYPLILATTIYSNEQAIIRMPLKFSIEDMEYRHHMRLIAREPLFRMHMREFERNVEFLIQSSLPSNEAYKTISLESFKDFMNPDELIPSSKTLPEYTIISWRSSYTQFLTNKLHAIQQSLENKEEWLRNQKKSWPRLLFCIKKCSLVMAKLFCASICYLIGGLTAKYAIKEQQAENLITSSAICAGGLYCTRKAANSFIECFQYETLINNGLIKTIEQKGYLEQKINELIAYRQELIEKKIALFRPIGYEIFQTNSLLNENNNTNQGPAHDEM